MNDTDIDARLEAATRIAKTAGELALGYFLARDQLAITHKAAQDRVSEADRAVETLIRDAILADFPEDALMGEEHGDTTGRSAFLWVIDPIDGTTPFLSGLADWCVSIAVAVAGEPVIGVIEAPRHRETWIAARGRGATVNGVKLRVDPEADLTSGMFAFGGSLRCDAAETGGFITRLMQSGCIAFHNGSGALMTAYVAAGRLVGYYDAHINAWDCFAGLVMVAEAGGVATFGGADRLQRGGPLLAGAPRAFTAARTLVDGLG
ncbi:MULTISPECIES: inositol monophosphatase family protein [Rhodomicrobium]|uniref:inositol monophosphatase family protein n=1 Tax=Rhodomicrobium TaxID=1068 RepID=UPI000B4B6163|nr:MULTISPECIES: inositol monophosphatase family protein [Rhodomicrobium]